MNLKRLWQELQQRKVLKHALLVGLSIIAVYVVGVIFVLGGIVLGGLGVVLTQWQVTLFLGLAIYWFVKDLVDKP